MRTVNSLFRKRVKDDWKYQFKVWRMAIDWTVAVYIVLPCIAVAIYNYAAWWTQLPGWIEVIPLNVVHILFSLVVLSGTLRFFIEEGDQLFLRQKLIWMVGLRQKAVRYSLISLGLTTLGSSILILPIMLNHFEWSVIQFFIYLFFCYVCRSLMSVIKQWVELRYHKLARFLLMTACYVTFGVIFFIVVINLYHQQVALLLLGIALLYPLRRLLHLRIQQQGGFMLDVQREQRRKQKVLSLILGQAVKVEKKSWFTPDAPLIFRKSTRFYKKRTSENVLAELGFKTFFRKWALVKLYLQFISVITIAIILAPPLWLKGTLWISGYLILLYWLNSYWKDFQTSAFVKMFKWNFGVMMEAGNKTAFLLTLPAYIVISLICGGILVLW